MTVVISMAGCGSRFTEVGYRVPKYRIQARGRSLFDWSMLSLEAFFDQTFVFACLENADLDWIRHAAFSLGIRNVMLHTRPAVSRGQAETVYDVLHLAPMHEPLWVYNIDTYVAKGLNPAEMDGFSGCIPVFQSDSASMSFVGFDEAGNVTRVVEKERISPWATVGLYGFKNAGEYSAIYEDAYLAGAISMVRNEYYIAPMYGLMLNKSKLLVAPKLDSKDVFILGTPAELAAFAPLALPPLGDVKL